MAVKGTMDAPQRRMVFGLNVVLQAVIVAALVVAVIWVAGRLAPRLSAWADWTGTGRNSLSSRSVKLVRNLDENVRITAVFAEPDKRDTLGQRRQRQLQDLLNLYDSVGGARISTFMLDPSLQKKETDELLARLLELPAYRDEARPHQEALESFKDVNAQIRNLAAEEYRQLEQLMQADPQLVQDRNLSIVQNNVRQLVRGTEDIEKSIAELQAAEIPQFGQAMRDVREYLTNVELLLTSASSWMNGEGLATPGLTPGLRDFFADSTKRYEPALTSIRGLQERTKDLEDVKIEEIYSNLTRWRTGAPVLVESEREAKVIPSWELWKFPSDQNMPVGPEGEEQIFAGEAAISSAILQLTQAEKTAVIFTRFGGEPLLKVDFTGIDPMMLRELPRAPYGQLSQMLEKANFVTAEWDVAQEKTPPAVEGASRRIYVMFPPVPPPRPNPRQPSPTPSMSAEDRQLVLGAIGESGMAIFLAGWQPPEMPMPGATGDYQYAEYLKSTWGIEVLYDYLTLHFMPHPDEANLWVPAGRRPELLTTDEVVRFTEHPIGGPLATERAGFLLVAPLAMASEPPEGVTVAPVATVRETEDVWAINDLPRLENEFKRSQGTRPTETSRRAPFPIALAAEKQGGGKVVVFASEHFASDNLAQASGLRQKGNALLLGLMYPANGDLFMNALHWLTGEADRIAVGPRSGELPRLGDLREATASRLPWLLVGVWPALALVAGIGVWMVRRR